MQRRDLLRILGTSTLLPFVPRSVEAASRFAHAAHLAAARRNFEVLTPAQAELVGTLADLIIPRTDTPGATDVGVPGFVDHLLAAWYHDDERSEFLAGLADIDRRSGGKFVALSPADQAKYLETIDGMKGKGGSAEQEFRRLKSLTLYGYFTSEKVVKEVTRDPIIPGRFDGCVHV